MNETGLIEKEEKARKRKQKRRKRRKKKTKNLFSSLFPGKNGPDPPRQYKLILKLKKDHGYMMGELPVCAG